MRRVVICAIAGLLAFVAGPAVARQPGPAVPERGLQVTFHLHCFSGVPEADRTRLEYWNAGIARGNPDPDCVSRTPLLPPVPLRSVSLRPDPESTLVVLSLEVDPSHQRAIEQALVAHQRRLVAVAVRGRIVSVVFVAGTTAEPRIAVHVADKAAAMELESDLKILLGIGG